MVAAEGRVEERAVAVSLAEGVTGEASLGLVAAAVEVETVEVGAVEGAEYVCMYSGSNGRLGSRYQATTCSHPR